MSEIHDDLRAVKQGIGSTQGQGTPSNYPDAGVAGKDDLPDTGTPAKLRPLTKHRAKENNILAV